VIGQPPQSTEGFNKKHYSFRFLRYVPNVMGPGGFNNVHRIKVRGEDNEVGYLTAVSRWAGTSDPKRLLGGVFAG